MKIMDIQCFKYDFEINQEWIVTQEWENKLSVNCWSLHISQSSEIDMDVEQDVIKMSRHMDQSMSATQRGIGRNTRGAKQQLLVDKAATSDSKTRHTKLCTAWTHYKKAYNSMAHAWILGYQKLNNINRKLIEFSRNSMGVWKINNSQLHKSTQEQHLPMKCSDPSPVLLNLLSQIITKTGHGCEVEKSNSHPPPVHG